MEEETQERPRESFTAFSVLPAMDRKQKQAEKVQYAQAAVINTFLFPLFFYASVISPPAVFFIPSPNLSLTALLRSHKTQLPKNRAVSGGSLSSCRFSCFFSVLNCWEEVWGQLFSHRFGSQRECPQWLCILSTLTMQSPESCRSV